MLPSVDDLFSIVCAFINAYRLILIRDVSNDNKVANIMLSLLNESNKLKEYVDNLSTKKEKTLKWTRIDANSAVKDFPVLSLEQLNDVTLGHFQLKQAKKYKMEHLLKDGSFTFLLTKQSIDIIRTQIQSRHRENVIYNLYIQYTSTSIVV